MAGFLSALSFAAPVGQTLGPALQQGAREQQAQRSRDAYGKVLDALGPEGEPFRQWFKAGGDPHEIGAAIGGPLGARLQSQHDIELTNRIMNDTTLSPQQRNQQLFANQLIPPSEYMKSLLPEKPVGNFEGWANDVEHIPPSVLRSLPTDQTEALQAKFQKSIAKGGDTELRQVYHPDTGITDWRYVPKSGEVGTSPGEVTPRVGANAQADLAVAQAGMQQLLPMLDKLPGGSNSDTPMWGAWLKTKAGKAISPEANAVRDQMSVIHATLIGMVMRSWGNRNPAAAEKYVDVHVPNFGDSPLAIKQKLNEWLRPNGLLQSYRGMIGTLSADQLRQLGVPPEEISKTLAAQPNDAATINDPYANPPGGEGTPAAAGGGGGEAGDFIDEHFGAEGESP